MEDKELKELFSAIASEGAAGQEAMRAFAASMTVPLRQSAKVESTVRNIFLVDELGPGEVAQYPVEAGTVEAYVMPRNGGVPQNIIAGDELFINTFEISAPAEWPIKYARDGRFNVAKRELQRMQDAITTQENTNGWNIIRAMVDSSNTVNTAAGATSLSKTELNKIVKSMDNVRGYTGRVCVLNANRWGDIRDWATTEIAASVEEEIHTATGLGSLWGITFIKNPDLADDEVYLFDNQKFGQIAIRQDVTVLEDPTAVRSLRIGFIGFEDIGFAGIDKEAVRKLAFV